MMSSFSRKRQSEQSFQAEDDLSFESALAQQNTLGNQALLSQMQERCSRYDEVDEYNKGEGNRVRKS